MSTLRMHRGLVGLCGLVLLVLAGCEDKQPAPFGFGDVVRINGVASFERVPATAGGLNYGGIVTEPIRSVEVRVRLSDGTTFDSDITDASGAYSVLAPATETNLRIEVAPVLFSNGNESVRVFTDGVLESLAVGFDTGKEDTRTLNLTASSGWGGSSYTNPRSAAPFAILDTIRRCHAFMLQTDASLTLPNLDVVWRTNAVGSFYLPGSNVMVIGGLEDADTDEYDQHVIAHEYGHYVTDNFARDDSLGGPHGADDILDETVAFSEGFATAFAGMVLADSVYVDTGGAGQAAGFGFDMEDGSLPIGTTVSAGALGGSILLEGFYNEASVMGVIWDIYDSTDDGVDTLSLGFAPIWSALINGHSEADAFTSILTLLTNLRPGLTTADQTVLDAIAAYENIAPSNQYEDLGFGIGPRYTALILDGGDQALDAGGRTLATHEEFGSVINFPGGEFNKLYNWQLFRTGAVLPAGTYTVTVTPLTGDTMIGIPGPLYDGEGINNGNGVTDTVIFDWAGDGPLVLRVGSYTGPTAFTIGLTGGPTG